MRAVLSDVEVARFREPLFQGVARHVECDEVCGVELEIFFVSVRHGILLIVHSCKNILSPAHVRYGAFEGNPRMVDVWRKMSTKAHCIAPREAHGAGSPECARRVVSCRLRAMFGVSSVACGVPRLVGFRARLREARKKKKPGVSRLLITLSLARVCASAVLPRDVAPSARRLTGAGPCRPRA